MGDKKELVYLFILQLIVVYLIVILFLIVMLVIVGNVPVTILFTAPGILLQIVLIGYFWLLVFSRITR